MSLCGTYPPWTPVLQRYSLVRHHFWELGVCLNAGGDCMHAFSDPGEWQRAFGKDTTRILACFQNQAQNCRWLWVRWQPNDRGMVLHLMVRISLEFGRATGHRLTRMICGDGGEKRVLQGRAGVS